MLPLWVCCYYRFAAIIGLFSKLKRYDIIYVVHCKMAAASDIIYPGDIESVKFYILGEEDYLRQSYGLIKIGRAHV